ncbi:Os07g0644400, partial [Oryza sativa Japonica Group]
MRILSQQDTAEELWPAIQQPLKPCQPQISIILIIQPAICEEFLRQLVHPILPARFLFPLTPRTLLLGCLQLCRKHTLLELCVRLKHHAEFLHRHHRSNPLFEDIPRLLIQGSSDVVIGQGGPQLANLIGELANAAPQYSVHLEPRNLIGMLGEDFAELKPELVLGLTLDGAEAVIVEHGREAVGGLLPAVCGDEEIDEVLSVGGVVLEVSSEDAERGLDGAGRERGEAEVERPDAVVLRDGERAQRAVEGAARAREQALVEQRGEVEHPDAGHLVHGGEGALEGVVEGGVGVVGDGVRARVVEALAEVGVPQLVAPRERLERALVDDGALGERRGGAGDEVAPPPLELERLAQDLLLVRQVVLRRVHLRRDPQRLRRRRRRRRHGHRTPRRRRHLSLGFSAPPRRGGFAPE